MTGLHGTCITRKKIIAQEDSSNSPYLSLIRDQGPLHVSLNAQDDVIQIYHFFFYRLYKDIFATELPKKPKPFRVQPRRTYDRIKTVTQPSV